MRALLASVVALATTCVLGVRADAVTVGGGGSKTTDCMVVLEAPGANKPPAPKTPKHVDCTDGDVSCDVDGLRNAQCVFDLQVCVNSTSASLPYCTPDQTNSVTVSHAVDDGLDPRFDPDFQALQTRVNTLGFPGNDLADDCTASSAITVLLRPKKGGKFVKNNKKLQLEGLGLVSGKDTKDKDKMKFTCRAEGDAIYLPTDLYSGTFDRIVQEVFVPTCATSSCHDSESQAGGLTLLAGAAYSQLVGVLPSDADVALAGLERVTPGDPDLSYLYRKLVPDLEPGWGVPMPAGQQPIPPEQLELIRLWILGDGVLGPAPQFGWVDGTDQ